MGVMSMNLIMNSLMIKAMITASKMDTLDITWEGYGYGKRSAEAAPNAQFVNGYEHEFDHEFTHDQSHDYSFKNGHSGYYYGKGYGFGKRSADAAPNAQFVNGYEHEFDHEFTHDQSHDYS